MKVVLFSLTIVIRFAAFCVNLNPITLTVTRLYWQFAYYDMNSLHLARTNLWNFYDFQLFQTFSKFLNLPLVLVFVDKGASH